ncbi:hypothetical protein EYF80_066507 [Liparis tanakae]|uniref:Uncharacterized protein n=1 Tax=Liparis tanakae TaxID=230148 RepID=A0A4Z2E416_9TELE|nr:hypothetical protein EYF80_066507 [Liparis tanakae]
MSSTWSFLKGSWFGALTSVTSGRPPEGEVVSVLLLSTSVRTAGRAEDMTAPPGAAYNDAVGRIRPAGLVLDSCGPEGLVPQELLSTLSVAVNSIAQQPGVSVRQTRVEQRAGATARREAAGPFRVLVALGGRDPGVRCRRERGKGKKFESDSINATGEQGGSSGHGRAALILLAC